MNRMNADEEDVMFMDMKWTAILQLAQEDWESKFSHILSFICVHPCHLSVVLSAVAFLTAVASAKEVAKEEAFLTFVALAK